MTDKSSTNARFNDTAFKKGKFIAKQQHRSFNNLLEFLLDECIRKYEKENGTISQSDLEEL